MSTLSRRLRPRVGASPGARAPLGALAASMLLILLALAPGSAGAATRNLCYVPDNGAGSPEFLHTNGGYNSRPEAVVMLNGLPPGEPVLGTLSLRNVVIGSSGPGGTLGGETATYTADLVLVMHGTGAFAGFSRSVTIPLTGEAHCGPRVPGTMPQSFDTDMFMLQGQLPPGDPDFDLLRITAGSGFGMPSPGHTTLTRQPGGDWTVDSFFDITYRVDFVGHPGGTFGGMSGSTVAEDRFHEGRPERVVGIVSDNGVGSIQFPPDCPGGYQSLPGRALCEVAPLSGDVLRARISITSPLLTLITPGGGSLGWEQEDFNAKVVLEVYGTGSLSSYHRVIPIGVSGQTGIGPPNYGVMDQGFPTDLAFLQGQLPPGDPDFDLLRITAGSSYGMPSPGHTTLHRQPTGRWAVDSFFDITYRIDFVGHPGGPLGGYSGSLTSMERFETGRPFPQDCVMPDNGTGTASFPPDCPTGHRGRPQSLFIVSGLPSGSHIQADMSLTNIVVFSEGPGGSLGGNYQQWTGMLTVQLTGTGLYGGYSRSLTVPMQGTTHSGPQGAGTTPQEFDTDMFMLQGQLPPGDPDFDLLRITGGSGFGMPSPGHTTLWTQPGGHWAVNSFFDITYRIDFIGSPGGTFGGMSGSTSALNVLSPGPSITVAAPSAGLRAFRVDLPAPNPSLRGSSLSFELPRAGAVRAEVYDAAGRLVRRLADRPYDAGRHSVAWDGADATGQPVASGLYFYRLGAAGAAATRKVAVAR
ncbi:MAG: T9SS type A sorting domain-containing protein [Candidatus Eisenbacteria bacterium]|nr:T9SS type A sorting domain-containing protein [Candidatus Eisenbacteria bacterium]